MTSLILIRWAAPAVLAGLLVSGCGSSTSSGQGTSAAGQSAFQQCLRQHGFSLPSGRPSFSGTPSPGTSFPAGGFPSGRPGGAGGSAFQACRKYAPAGFRASGGPGGINASALAAFISCLKQNGVKVSGSGLAALASLRTARGKTAQAVRTCRPLLPQGIPAPTSTG